MMNLKLKQDQNEEGFTLIELLVVVIIIGILAAIAIPVFLNQRERAWAGSVESDLRNAAVQMETYFTKEGTYPLDADAQGEFSDAQLPSQDVTLTVYDTQTDDSQFCIDGEHSSLVDDNEDPVTFSYSSAHQGLQAEGDACSDLSW